MKLQPFVALIAVTASSAVFAAPLTPRQALERAAADRSCLRAVPGLQTRAGETSLSFTQLTEKGSPAAYVFNVGNQNFMVLSADDTSIPLLAYGENPVEETSLPPNMKQWLSGYASQIEKLTESSGEAPMPSRFASRKTKAAEKAPIAPLLSTKWNQDAPYNDQCPEIRKKKTYTGCVATALAQVMKCFNWPPAGEGNVEYTDGKGNSYEMTFGTFDWENMLDNYSGPSTQAQKDAVAFLMKSCGHGVEMTYGTNESGASDDNIVKALRHYFDYDPGVCMLNRDWYTKEEWEDLVYDNLLHIGPVIYSGSTAYDGNGGHAFVCDGYDGDGYYHINWGWGGEGDGNFLLSILDPVSQGIGGSEGGFSFMQDVILGIKPNTPGAVAPVWPIYQMGALCLALSGDKGAYTADFSCTDSFAAGFWNYNNEKISVEYGAIMVGPDGKEISARWNRAGIANLDWETGYYSFSVKLPALADGAYKVFPAYKVKGGKEWNKMHQSPYQRQYCIIEVRNGEYSVVEAGMAKPEIVKLETKSIIYSKDKNRMELTVRNGSEKEIMHSLGIGLELPDDPGILLATTGGKAVCLSPGESDVFVYDETFQWYGEAEDGEYNLVVYDMNTEEIFYSAPCELKTDAGETTVRLNSFSVKGDPDRVNADELTFEIDLDCLSGHFDAPLYIYIWHYDKDKQDYDDDYVKMITVGYDYLDGGENLSLEVKDNFKEGIIGDYYYASLYYYTSDFNELANAGFYVDSSSSGITETEADSVETPVYYDLTGRRAALPLKKGIYIRRAGGKTSKIAVD